jgi:hypothetical protein
MEPTPCGVCGSGRSAAQPEATMKTKRYLVKDAETGEQIYTSYSRRPKPFSLRKTVECDVAWDTTSSSWSGYMERAKESLSRQYGKPVALEEAGEVEFFPV